MIGTEALVERLRSLEDALAEQGVAHLAIFGSRARGDAREESDLDLLIDVAPGRKSDPGDRFDWSRLFFTLAAR